jgi:hypothetical protein
MDDVRTDVDIRAVPVDEFAVHPDFAAAKTHKNPLTKRNISDLDQTLNRPEV